MIIRGGGCMNIENIIVIYPIQYKSIEFYGIFTIISGLSVANCENSEYFIFFLKDIYS